MTATSRCPTSRAYMYMGEQLFIATPPPSTDQIVPPNRLLMPVEPGSSAPDQHRLSRHNRPVHLHLKMASANDALVVLVARKTDVSVDPGPKGIYQPRTLQLPRTLPVHMDFTNTLRHQHPEKCIRTINNIMNFSGVS